jgi:hypothetical protein
MDIYPATGCALLVLGVCLFNRAHFTRTLFLVATALALNGCLSLKLGSNGEPSTTVSQTAGPSVPSGNTAETVPPPKRS